VLWWFDRSRRLTRDQTRMLARNDADHPFAVADISLWEIAALVEIGRVRLALPVDEWLARATAAPRVEVQPVTPAIASEVIASDRPDSKLLARAKAAMLQIIGGPPATNPSANTL
jgi:PIN domain nuclease of toxin-antitoxin system